MHIKAAIAGVSITACLVAGNANALVTPECKALRHASHILAKYGVHIPTRVPLCGPHLYCLASQRASVHRLPLLSARLES
jgi:hypothetical protein